ncbi:unnamed protein product [Brassica napus]|uniref:(rape) hypothetical protein n=1 Tax=Brassica napus TaxID=3708 RepID=A0A816K6U1_BRANA|nr:unnamed protein product [Brassica napus]
MFRVQFVYQLPEHRKALSDLDTFPSSTTTSLLSQKPNSNIQTERRSLVTVDLEPVPQIAASGDALYVSPPLQWTPGPPPSNSSRLEQAQSRLHIDKVVSLIFGKILFEVIDSSKHRQQVSLWYIQHSSSFSIIGMLNRAGTWTSR